MKGCIAKLFFFIIIFAAVVVYIIDKYGKDYYETSRERINKSFVEQLEKQFNNLTTDLIDDSLKTSIKNKLETFKSENVRNTSKKLNDVIKDINNYLDKHKSNSQEIKHIKKMIKDYEQRKKD
ncbi:MAG: hypothetical protein KKB34_16905 [Bacteroidetes bacterium]|nr:hypothetical protein [Bacteroidota bacterium]